MSNQMDACYSCQYRGEVPGSAHSCCQHPAVKADAIVNDPAVQLIGVLGRRSGHTSVPSTASRTLHICAAEQGIRRGWFIWPVNFDPVWLERCDGYAAKDAQVSA